MPYISNGKILKCSLQKSFQSSSRSPLWSVRRRLQSKCSSGVSSPHAAADHLDLVLSPEYDEPRSLQVGAEMKIEALQEKTTGDGWLGMLVVLQDNPPLHLCTLPASLMMFFKVDIKVLCR